MTELRPLVRLWGTVCLLCAWLGGACGHACPITNGIYVAACQDRGLEVVPWDLPHSIHMFHLENNKLATLTGKPFFKFVQMEELWLGNNSLSMLEDGVFQGGKELLWLDLSDNKLSSFPARAFRDTPQLRHLILSNNHIGYIDNGAFSHLGQLQNLYLNSNRLHAIAPQGFAGLRSLRWLELQNNLLRRLDPQTVSSFTPKELLAVKLHQNPWHCDCSARWLKQWLVAMATNHTFHWEFDLARPVCHSPWLVEGKPMSAIPDSFYVCPVHIISRSQNVELAMTDTAKLVCEVNADPPATVFWYKNGALMDIEGSDKYDVVNDGTVHLRSSLFIYNFQPPDMGSYNCRAVNPAGANNVTFMVTLEGLDPGFVAATQPVVVRPKLNLIAIIAIVVGSLVFVLALLVVVCVLIYRRRRSTAPPNHYGVTMKLGEDGPPPQSPDDNKQNDDDIAEDMMKECNKMDSIDPLYDSVKARNIQYRNSLNTSTYISFKSEPSESEDLAALYASIPKRRYNGSVSGSHNESLSPLLTPYHIVPPRLPQYVDPALDPVLEPGDCSTLPLRPPPCRPPSRTPSHCSTPPQFRQQFQPHKSCSMGSLGLTPPKKPPRLHTYSSRDPMGPSPGGSSPRNRSSVAGTASLLEAADSYSTAV